ncbi:MAG: MFS transporter [Janthinobacterium lividum]
MPSSHISPLPIADGAIEAAVSKKLLWHFTTFLFFLFIAAGLDRSNVSFAALTMNRSLGFDPSVFGTGAGLFFVGYCLFGVPSNLILEKLGSRRWLSIITIVWALISASTAFVHTPTQFYVVRMLLGLAEAGVGPGVVLMITYWSPKKLHARFLAVAGIASLIIAMVNAPVSAQILVHLNGPLGLQSWQWLFLIEAVPAIVMGIVILLWVAPKPQDAKWLTPEEKQWLIATIESERSGSDTSHGLTIGRTLIKPRVMIFCAIYFFQVMAYVGLQMWTPLIVQSHGLGTTQIGWTLGLANAISAIGVIWWSRRSDRTGERKWHLIIPLLASAIGLIAAGNTSSIPILLVSLTIALWGGWCSVTIFMTIPTAYLTGAAAAAGLAFIQAIGNIGGFVSPTVIGWVRKTSGSFAGGLYTIAFVMLLATLLSFIVFAKGPAKTDAEAVRHPV